MQSSKWRYRVVTDIANTYKVQFSQLREDAEWVDLSGAWATLEEAKELAARMIEKDEFVPQVVAE
jgi:hypothetical protein